MTTDNKFTELYIVLGLTPEATHEEIKKAYRKKSMEVHPDQSTLSNEDAVKAFNELKQAYDILSDPHKRKVYDASGKTTWIQQDKAVTEFVQKQLLEKLFQYQETSFERQDVLYMINEIMNEIIEKGQRVSEQIGVNQRKIENMIKRMERKEQYSGQPDKLMFIFQAKINDLNLQRANIEDEIKFMQYIKDLFNEYDYKIEDFKEGEFNPLKFNYGQH